MRRRPRLKNIKISFDELREEARGYTRALIRDRMIIPGIYLKASAYIYTVNMVDMIQLDTSG